MRIMWGIVLILIAVVVNESTATAASRTVCIDLAFWDFRSNCPVGGTGSQRPCATVGNLSYAVGHRVELWDKNSTPALYRYIGLYRTTAAGNQCFTFEWENASYSAGEPNPDVYIVYINEVERTTGGMVVVGTDTNGNPLPKSSWRDYAVAQDCPAATTCQIAPGVYHSFGGSTDLGNSIAGLDSAQHFIERFTPALNSWTVQLRHPSTDPTCPSTGGAQSRTVTCFPSGLVADGHLVAHEMGHVMQMQNFAQDGLRDDVSYLGGGWGLGTSSFEYQSGATTEGFATYAALASWWDPSNGGTVPVGWSIDFEDATLSDASCYNNSWLPRQVAKAFWDLDDANNEGGAGAASAWADGVNQTSAGIAWGWAQFANGTANRQNDETSINGVNLWDYDFNSNQDDTSFLNHNCMQWQEN